MSAKRLNALVAKAAMLAAIAVPAAALVTARSSTDGPGRAPVSEHSIDTPAASIDLGTREGAVLVKGEWRYSDTRIVEVDFKGPGADGQPTGAPVKTYDYAPKAGAADYDDSRWAVIDPTTLTAPRDGTAVVQLVPDRHHDPGTNQRV